MNTILEHIAGTILDQHGFSAGAQETARVSAHLRAKIDGMPLLFGTAMTVLVIVFNVSGLFTAGKLFSAQGRTERARQLGQWKNSALDICRSFTAFFEKMTIFIYFSENPAMMEDV